MIKEERGDEHEREPQQKKLTQEVKKASARYYKELMSPIPTPSFFRLMLFRMSRTNIKFVDQKLLDYHYYKEKGWFESDYYYAISLGLIKKMAGHFLVFLGRQVVKRFSG